MQKRNLTRFIAIFAITLMALAGSSPNIKGQGEREVECGDIIESEFYQNRETHTYILSMKPKESFTVSIESTGEHLESRIKLYGPTGILLAESSGLKKAPSVESGILSARGTYNILVTNENLSSSGGVGVYTIYVGCKTINGTINPGSSFQTKPTPAPLPTPTPRSAIPADAPDFTGTGFPGLASVDFADAVTVPLLLDKEMIGVIPLDNQILGFTLDAAAGDTLDLSYTRVSGNMNLGLVVLSENNKVFFQASLVTSESLATRFTLPEAGQYTIGVFRIRLVEPAAVEPTVFQVQGSLTAE